jgi:hypothetical protein
MISAPEFSLGLASILLLAIPFLVLIKRWSESPASET